jgi:hypothetical protein
LIKEIETQPVPDDSEGGDVSSGDSEGDESEGGDVSSDDSEGDDSEVEDVSDELPCEEELPYDEKNYAPNVEYDPDDPPMIVRLMIMLFTLLVVASATEVGINFLVLYASVSQLRCDLAACSSVFGGSEYRALLLYFKIKPFNGNPMMLVLVMCVLN